MRLLLLLAAAATAFAQPDTGTITVNASRNVTAIPDQLRYGVSLTTAGPAALSDVVSQLAGTGIAASDLSYVTSAGQSIDWTFNLVTPFSKMGEMNATLVRLQQQIGKLDQSPAMRFGVVAQQTSTDATAQACPLAALVSDARKEADRIASAAGVRVGAITGLSQVPASTAYAVGAVLVPTTIYDPTFAFKGTGGSLGLAQLILQQYQPLPTYTEPCNLLIQFRLVP